MTTILLETNRLSLRRLSGEDLPLLVDLDSDPEVMRYLNGGVPLQEEYLRDKVLPHMLQYYDRFSDRGYWAAHELATHAFVGWLYLLPVDEAPGAAEIGFRTRRVYWGKGYATELAVALINHGFRRPELEVVEARAMLANRASIRLLEKIGLRFVEFFQDDRFPGQDKQAALYRAYREEWIHNHGAETPTFDLSATTTTQAKNSRDSHGEEVI